MSTITCAVTGGKVFTKDGDDKALVTLDDLNQLGVPTVVANLSGVVDSEDIIALKVTAAKLENTVADAILTATATVSDEATNVVTVTVQIKDIQGNSLSEQCVFDFWLSDTAGAVLTSDTFTGDGIAATTGTIIKEWADNTHCRCITDDTGKLVLTFTETGANTLYFNLILNNKYVAGSQKMTWTA